VHEPLLSLLLADDDAGIRSLVAARASERIEALAVLEAANGAEAIQIGLQHRPQLALLDVDMPGLGGIDAALTLRGLRPQLRVALNAGEPRAHRDRARELRLPLFDKLDVGRALGWLEWQAEALMPLRRSFTCSSCGYGVARPAPPERCPMCQRVGAWIEAPRPSFIREPQLSR
jgi:CheY-like chemotaxis protein